MDKRTPEEKRVMWQEPVYAVATVIYNASVAGRLVAASVIEGLAKGNHWQAGGPAHSYVPQTAPGLHETIQSKLARVKPTVETVNAQLYSDGTVNIGG